MKEYEVVITCPCGNEFEATWYEGSMMDWSCDECGRRLGLDAMRVKEQVSKNE